MDDANYTSYLVFDNTDEEWKRMELGKQGWVCGELLDFAQKEKVKIRIRFVSWERALSEINSHGKDYDIIQVPSTWTAYLSEKLLIPFTNDPNLSRFPDNLSVTCRPADSQMVYAIPWQIDLRVLYVRRELTDEPAMLKTFKDLSDCLRTRKESQGKRPSWEAPMGVSLARNWNILHDTFRYFFGEAFLEKRDDDWKVAFTQDEALKGIKTLIELRRDGLVHFERIDDSSILDWKVMAQGLVDGRYDASFGGLYMGSIFDEHPECTIYAVAPPAFGDATSGTFLGGSHLGMTSVKGRKLIEYLTMEESGVEMYRSTAAVPANRDALKKFFAENPRWNSLDIETLLKFAQPYPPISQWAKIIEDQTGLDRFYNALESIANGRDFYTVSVELDAAAREIQEAIDKGIPPSPPPQPYLWFIIIISLIAIVLLALIYIIWKLIDLTGKINDLRKYFEEKHPVIIRALADAEAEITGRFSEFQEQMSPLFSIISSGIDNIKGEIQGLETGFRSVRKKLNKLDKLDETYSQIEEIRDNIDTVKGITGTSNSNLEQVEKALDAVIVKLDAIYKDVVPSKKIPVAECELQADFGYDFNKVDGITLELRLLRNGALLRNVLAVRQSNVKYLFELLILRELYNKGPSEKGLNWSDYLFVEGYNATLNNPPQRYFARFRGRICRFVAGPCLIQNASGRNIREEFLIKACSPSPPKYEFVLDRQMGFRCNIIDSTEHINQSTSITANKVIQLLQDSPRCISGWAKLGTSSLSGLTAQQRTFVNDGKAMLKDDVIRYLRMARMCRSPGGVRTLEMYVENWRMVRQNFKGWFKTLKKIYRSL
jgi:ABC-type glycerol-3-phosphate transport system substrate-binding protein